jgi:hypothetical protein
MYTIEMTRETRGIQITRSRAGNIREIQRVQANGGSSKEVTLPEGRKNRRSVRTIRPGS